MSRLFYDHFVKLDNFESRIKLYISDSVEKEELYKIVDEIIHHRVVGSLLELLEEEDHHEFMSLMSANPCDDRIMDYLSLKAKSDANKALKECLFELERELDEMLPKKVKEKEQKKKKKLKK